MIGKTNSQIGSGGSIKGEKLNISLTSNQASHSDLIGAIITVIHPGGSTEYVWEGSEITINVLPYVEYTVSYSNIVGYKTPESFSSIAVPENSRSLKPVYETTVVTVVMDDNQPSLDDVANATATVIAEGLDSVVLHTGDSIKIPVGIECTIHWAELEGYKTPASQTFTTSGVEMNVSGTYLTEIVHVTISADNGDSLNGVLVSINGKSYVWDGEEIVQKVAFGTEYSVSVGELDGFKTPDSQNGILADQVTREVSLTYILSLLQVSILSNQKNDQTFAELKAKVEYEDTVIEVLNGQGLSLPIDVEVTITFFEEVDGYKTPDPIIFTYTGGVVEKIGTYKTEALTINICANQGTVNGGKASILACETVGESNEYVKLEYIEAFGGQWIDTGFHPDNNSRIILDFQATQLGTNNIIGTRDTTSSQVFTFSIASDCWRAGYNTSSKITTVTADMERHVVDLNKNITSLDEAALYTFTAKEFNGYSSVYIGAIHASATGYNGYVKIYSCKMYDNDVLVRDYVPVMNLNGTVGLYDIVNGVFRSSNTGSGFKYGESNTLIAEQTMPTGTYKIPFDKVYMIQSSDVEGFIKPNFALYTASKQSREVFFEYQLKEVRDLSKMDVNGNPILQTTANCYVVKEIGVYKFPLVFGNALNSGEENPSSYTNINGSYTSDFIDYNKKIISSPYIETVSGAVDSAQLSIADADGVFTNFSIIDGENCRYVKFEVVSIPETGANGVISVKNGSGVIMWNWHIWIWPYSLNPETIINKQGVSYKIMPVNLATTYDSGYIGKRCKSWYYQFGRSVPMMSSSDCSFTSFHTSYGALTFKTASTTSTKNLGIRNPNIFYKKPSTNEHYCWFNTDADKIRNLWDASNDDQASTDKLTIKTVYDPCPVGWKVPNAKVLTTDVISEDSIVDSYWKVWKVSRFPGDLVGLFFDKTSYIYGSDGTFAGGNTAFSTSLGYDTPSGGGRVVSTISNEGVNENPNFSPSYGVCVRPVEDLSFQTPNMSLTIHVSGDVKTPYGYTISVYEVNEKTDINTGEVVEVLGDLIAKQSIPSDTCKIPFGIKYRIIASDIKDFSKPNDITLVANTSVKSIGLMYEYNPMKDLSMYDVYGSPIKRTTANCYVVSKVGDYKFPLVYGNAIKNGQVNTAAFTPQRTTDIYVNSLNNKITQPYISCVEGNSVGITNSDCSAISNLELDSENGYISFRVNEIPQEGGNVIISLLGDASSGCENWNWHIWLWPHDLTPVEITNATNVKYNIMPVNLATKLDDGVVYGTGMTTGYKNWFYQHGRSVPMLCPASYNSSERHPIGTISIQTESQGYHLSIQNPTVFYEPKYSVNGAWFNGSVTSGGKFVQHNDLWDSTNNVETGCSDKLTVKTIYDPCPAGWKVPVGNTFTGMTFLKAESVDNGGCWVKRYEGDTVGVFIPATGYLDDQGSLVYVNTYGIMWTSSIADLASYAYCFRIKRSSIYPQQYEKYCLACSVRPVQDTELLVPTHKLTINVSMDEQTSSDYTISVYQVDYTVNEETGEVVENLVRLLATQTTLSETHEIPWGVKYKIVASEIADMVKPNDEVFISDTEFKTVGLRYRQNTAIDLSLWNVYEEPIQRSTANCYVVKNIGEYKIPLVFGNALKNGCENVAAYTASGLSKCRNFVDYKGVTITTPYIESLSGTAASAQLSISDTYGIFTDIAIVEGSPCRYLQFKVSSIPKTGANGILSIKDSKGTIMWSWHIWVWADDLSMVEITNETSVKYNIMPVNLASRWDSEEKTSIKNWFYQWGRPNPMLCPSSAFSNSDHLAYGELEFSTIDEKASNYQTGIKNPTTFYCGRDTDIYNWFGSSSYRNLWDAAYTYPGFSDNDVVKTVYDPCPVGFKIPNGKTFSSFSLSNVIGSFDGGYKFKRYSGDTTGVFFPASGYRYAYWGGDIEEIKNEGYVWASGFDENDSIGCLRFTSSNIWNTYYTSSDGFSIRPVEDDNIQLDVIMINFTFNNNYEFTCESGMTWFEFLNSDYYKDSDYSGIFTIDSSYIAYNQGVLSGYYLTDENGIKVTISDNVIGGHYYGTTCCFVAGTQVTVDLQGSTKNIEDIQIGDLVVSYDLEKQENYITEVVKLIKNHRSIYMAKLTFDNGTVLDMTDYHPILTEGGVFKSLTDTSYEKLELNDVCKTYEGYSKLINIEMYELDKPITTYTLAVQNIGEYPEDDTTDNFYANGIVVHNAGADVCIV